MTPATAQEYQERFESAMAAPEYLTLIRNQFVGNLAALRGLPGIIAWRDRFQNVPAIVVSAGPSLENAVEFLRTWNSRFLVICVDAARAKLRDAGVAAHITVTTDPRPKCAEYIAARNAGEPVVMLPFAHPATLAQAGRGAVIYTEIVNPDHAMYKEFWCDVHRECFGGNPDHFGQLFPGGTVSAAANMLAWYMGCPEAINVGLDLSWTRVEDCRCRWKDVIETTDMHGRPVLTSPAFHASALWYAECLPGFPGTRWINASRQGIASEGFEQMNISEACARFAGPEVNHAWQLRKRLKDSR